MERYISKDVSPHFERYFSTPNLENIFKFLSYWTFEMLVLYMKKYFLI